VNSLKSISRGKSSVLSNRFLSSTRVGDRVLFFLSLSIWTKMVPSSLILATRS